MLFAVLKTHHLQAAAGRPCGDLSKRSVFVEQAMNTLRYMKVLKKDALLCSYDQFTMIRLLDELKDDVDFGNFQIEDVRALQTYDMENKTDLCATLLCYAPFSTPPRRFPHHPKNLHLILLSNSRAHRHKDRRNHRKEHFWPGRLYTPVR